MYRAYFVDDAPLVLEEMIKNPVFEECGFEAAGSSTDPQAARKEIKRLHPDVVFTDLKMPGCSGIELMEDLRKSGVTCEFVLISAYAEFQESRRFFKMDGIDYLIKPVSDHELQSLLNTIAGKLAAKRTIPGQEKPEDTISTELNQLIEYLKENISEKHTLESLSEAQGIHARQISRLFSNYLGTTFVAYLTKLRMEEAVNLLRNTQKDVKEIAGLCGFIDYFYFCRIFREYHGCTPTAFREGTL